MFFDVTWDASKKRVRKTVDLGLEWLDYLLQNLTSDEKVSILREGGEEERRGEERSDGAAFFNFFLFIILFIMHLGRSIWSCRRRSIA